MIEVVLCGCGKEFSLTTNGNIVFKSSKIKLQKDGWFNDHPGLPAFALAVRSRMDKNLEGVNVNEKEVSRSACHCVASPRRLY